MCWQIKPWLPSWSPVLLAAGWGYGCWVRGARMWLRPANLDALLSTTAWYGGMPGLPLGRGCATLFMGTRGGPGWGHGDPCHASSQNPHLTPPVSISLSHSHITQSASPTTVNWGTTNRARRETDELGVCYIAPALADTKLQKQVPSLYILKLVSSNKNSRKKKRLKLDWFELRDYFALKIRLT